MGALSLVVGPQAVAARASAAPQPINLFSFSDSRIKEASGLAVDPKLDVVYTQQDAGEPAAVYVVGANGATRSTVTVNAPNVDWEDLALGRVGGRPVLFLSDTGDDSQRRAPNAPRRDFAIVRLDLPNGASTAATQAARGVVRYRFAYLDRQARNAESLLVLPGTEQFFVVQKVQRGKAGVFAGPRSPSTAHVNDLTQVGELAITGLSGGAVSPDGDRVVLRDATHAYVFHVPDGDVAAALNSTPTRVLLPHEGQGEAISFDRSGRSLLVTGEGRAEPVWQVPLPPAAAAGAAAAPSAAAVTSTGEGAAVPSGLPAWLLASIAAASLAAVGVALAPVRRHRRRAHA
ncbi:MAG: hypothetical protein ACTHLJ_08230 [Angustibacter sp.]